MLSLWPHWLRPYWIVLLPLLGWLLWQLWHRQQRTGRWHQLINPAFHQALLSSNHSHPGRLRWVLLGIAWLLALCALLGPSWQQYEQPARKPFAPLVIMLELTPEMLASDGTPTRLHLAKRKIQDLLAARVDAQTALIVYAGSAHTVVPLSDDQETIRNLLDSLKPSIMPEPGRRADLAIKKGLALLQAGAAGQGQLLLIGTDIGVGMQNDIRRTLGKQAKQLSILGAGTTQGAPIATDPGGFARDANNSIIIARLDHQRLQQFADAIDARYQRMRSDDQDLQRLQLLQSLDRLSERGDSLRFSVWMDQGYWFLVPLLLLAACAGRRGWLFCLPLLLLNLPQTSYAFTSEDLWLRDDQQGLRLLQAQRPQEAALRFKDPQWQGVALYQAGDYQAAADRFAQSDEAASHYNRGNALAQAGQLEAALDAYDHALERQPELQAAQLNKQLVERLLEQQKATPESPAASQSQAETSNTPSESGAPQSNESHTSTAESEQPPPHDNLESESSATEAGPSTAIQNSAPNPNDEERQQSMEQWLRKVPDEPGELLQRKFRFEQQQREVSPP